MAYSGIIPFPKNQEYYFAQLASRFDTVELFKKAATRVLAAPDPAFSRARRGSRLGLVIGRNAQSLLFNAYGRGKFARAKRETVP